MTAPGYKVAELRAKIGALESERAALRELVRDFAANAGNYWSCNESSDDGLYWICCDRDKEHAHDCGIARLLERARAMP